MTELHRSLAANLKTLRARYELSLAALAERAGVSVGFVGEIEVGRKFPSAESLEKMAVTLHVKPWQLLMNPSDMADYQKYLDSFDMFNGVAEKITEKVLAYLAERKI